MDAVVIKVSERFSAEDFRHQASNSSGLTLRVQHLYKVTDAGMRSVATPSH